MQMRQGILAAASVVLAAALGSAATHAAPLGGGPGSAVGARAEASGIVEKAAIRQCWFVDGVRHCRLIDEPDDGYGYYDDGYCYYYYYDDDY